MSLNKKNSVIYSIAFFVVCIALIIHFLFSPLGSQIRRTIFIYTMMYGSGNLLLEIFKNRNTPNFRISANQTIGYFLGLMSGFYAGYLISIYIGVGSPVFSNIAVGICFGFGIANSQIGSFFGKFLFPR